MGSEPAKVVHLQKRKVVVDPNAEQVVRPVEKGATPIAQWAKRGGVPKGIWAADRYTDEQRREGVRLALETTIAEAAEKMNAPRATVANWVKDAGVDYQAHHDELAQRRIEVLQAAQQRDREELRALLVGSAVKVLKRIDEETIDYAGKDARKVTYPKAPARDVKDLSIAAAVLLDKYRLEAGEATGRVETKDITDHFDDDERRRLRDIIDGVLDPGRNSSAEGAGPAEAAGAPVEAGTAVRE